MEKHLGPNPSPVWRVRAEPTLNNWQLKLLAHDFFFLWLTLFLLKSHLVRRCEEAFEHFYVFLCLHVKIHVCRSYTGYLVLFSTVVNSRWRITLWGLFYEVFFFFSPWWISSRIKTVQSCNCDVSSLVTITVQSFLFTAILNRPMKETSLFSGERMRSPKLLEFGLFSI